MYFSTNKKQHISCLQSKSLGNPKNNTVRKKKKSMYRSKECKAKLLLLASCLLKFNSRLSLFHLSSDHLSALPSSSFAASGASSYLRQVENEVCCKTSTLSYWWCPWRIWGRRASRPSTPPFRYIFRAGHSSAGDPQTQHISTCVKASLCWEHHDWISLRMHLSR